MRFYNKIFKLAAMLLLVILAACGGAEDGDLTPPNFTFNGGVDSVTNDPGPHTFSGTSDPGTDISVEVFPPAGGIAATVENLTVNPDGSWSFVVNGLDEGLNQIFIEASDPIGNSRIVPIYITLDLTGPVVSFDQYTTPNTSTVQNFAGTVAELNADVEISIDGGLSWNPVDDVNGGIWQYNATFPGIGTYEVLVRGIDVLTNKAISIDPLDTLIVKRTIVIDNNVGSPDFAIDPPTTIPVLHEPADLGVVSLDGTLSTGLFNLVLTTSQATTLVFDDEDPNGPGTWSLDFDNLPFGITMAHFSIQNTDPVPAEVGEAHIMLVRDVSPPLVVDRIPAHGADLASPPSAISVTFSETMDPLSVDETVIVLQDDADPPNTIPVSTPTTADNRTFVFPVTLQPTTTYSVSVENSVTTTITDQYGNAFIPAAIFWSFETL